MPGTFSGISSQSSAPLEARGKGAREVATLGGKHAPDVIAALASLSREQQALKFENPSMDPRSNIAPEGQSHYEGRVKHLGAAPYRLVCAGILVALAPSASAQIDPVKRELIQLGYNYHLVGEAPLNAYGFYYFNRPQTLRSNLTLRLAIAPVYLDGELGVSGIARNTDLGIGFAGGGFAESYFEFREGEWIKGESFTGHGGGPTVSLYHLLNPADLIPLSVALRVGPHYNAFERDETAATFELPDNQWSYSFRAGLRWGGREPLLSPRLAMEISGWYEALLRSEPGAYGFQGDRMLNEWVHNLWGRALLIYTIDDWEHQFEINLSGGHSWNADRFGAFRLGGYLPFAEEFALTVPGYFFQEFSARSYGYFGLSYRVPIDSANHWQLKAIASGAWIDDLPGLEFNEDFIAGVGTGIGYVSPSGSWQAMIAYGYGLQAARPNRFAGHSIGFLLQFDLERYLHPNAQTPVNPYSSRGLLRLFRH